jgi:hypothetical protein
MLVLQSSNWNASANLKSCSLLRQYEALSLRDKVKGTNFLAYSTCFKTFYTTWPVEMYLMSLFSKQSIRYKV